MRALMVLLLTLLVPCSESAASWIPITPSIQIIHVWDTVPRIVVCPDAPGGLKRWKKAMRRTERWGAKWTGIVESDCAGPDRFQYGDVVVVQLFDDAEGIAGLTSMLPYDDSVREKFGAIVMLRRDMVSTHVPEHELLHAQGLDHIGIVNHVLEPTVIRGGWRADGVREALEVQWRHLD